MRASFSKLTSIVGCVLFIGIIALTFTPVSAFAASKGQLPSRSIRHCIVKVDTLKVVLDNSSFSKIICYGTFQEAVAAATNGRVHLSKDARPTDVKQAILDQNSTGKSPLAGENVISIMYDNANWDPSAGTLTITTTGGPCTATNTYGFTSLSQFGWNDRISSIQNYYGCVRAQLWENDNYGGATFDCYSCSYVGDAMNDRTSSVYWRYN